jgi:transcriptional regulator with XRE-family HTH domain
VADRPVEAQISNNNQPRNSHKRDPMADSARQKGTTVALTLVIIVLALILIGRILAMYIGLPWWSPAPKSEPPGSCLDGPSSTSPVSPAPCDLRRGDPRRARSQVEEEEVSDKIVNLADRRRLKDQAPLRKRDPTKWFIAILIVFGLFGLLIAMNFYLWAVDMITGEQVKAARRLLGWSQGEVAARAGVSVAAVRTLEAGIRRPNRWIVSMILDALAGGGVEFIGEKPGARLNPANIARPSIWLIESGNLWADETREFAGLTMSYALEQRASGFNGLARKYLEATFEQKVFIESLGDGTAEWLHHLASVADSIKDHHSAANLENVDHGPGHERVSGLARQRGRDGGRS